MSIKRGDRLNQFEEVMAVFFDYGYFFIVDLTNVKMNVSHASNDSDEEKEIISGISTDRNRIKSAL